MGRIPKFRGYAVEEMVGSQWIIGTGVFKREFTDEYAEEVGKKADYFVFGESGWVEVHGESIGEYTGIKDKNGVEVYEGDVLRLEAQFDLFVRFDDGCFFLTDTEKVRYNNEFAYSLKESLLQGYKVIGNIYENKDLLEVPHEHS